MITDRTSKNSLISFYISLLFILGAVFSLKAQEYSRGIGIYPGNPREDFSPSIKLDTVHYRNLALHRAAYQSGAYDYNLTAQLITDGIIDSVLPGWIITSTNTSGILERDGREHVLDRHASSQQAIDGSVVWLQVQMAGNYQLPLVDSLSLNGSLTIDTLSSAKHWNITVSGS